jgi:hypothetical protein
MRIYISVASSGVGTRAAGVRFYASAGVDLTVSGCVESHIYGVVVPQKDNEIFGLTTGD